MSSIQTDLNYLRMRLPSLEAALANATSETAENLVKNIDLHIGNIIINARGNADLQGQVEAFKNQWDSIKGTICPKAKVNTSDLTKGIETIRQAFLASNSSGSNPTPQASALPANPPERTAEAEFFAHSNHQSYCRMCESQPKLVTAFRDVLTLATEGTYGDRIQTLAKEFAPEFIEVRPLLRTILLETVENPKFSPEIIEQMGLEKLDKLKELLLLIFPANISPKEKADLTEALILGNLPLHYKNLEQELNRLTSLYTALPSLGSGFQILSQTLFSYMTSHTSDGPRLQSKLSTGLTKPPVHISGNEAINRWLEGLENPDSITGLDLESCCLNICPASLIRFPHLKSLRIGHNRLESLPPDFSEQLPNLIYLRATHNKIRSLPELPPNLKGVTMGNNLFNEFPQSFLMLQKIEVLQIPGCAIGSIPDAVADMPELEYLNLKRNGLTQENIPEKVQNNPKIDIDIDLE